MTLAEVGVKPLHVVAAVGETLDVLEGRLTALRAVVCASRLEDAHRFAPTPIFFRTPMSPFDLPIMSAMISRIAERTVQFFTFTPCAPILSAFVAPISEERTSLTAVAASASKPDVRIATYESPMSFAWFAWSPP